MIIPCPDNLSFKKRKSRVCLIICFENGIFTDTNVRNISKVIRSAINVGYTDTSFTNEDWITYLYWSSFEQIYIFQNVMNTTYKYSLVTDEGEVEDWMETFNFIYEIRSQLIKRQNKNLKLN